jgi:excinuclease ABC subunit C
LPRRACLYYRLGLSPAPCEGRIGKGEYARTVKNISLILEGRTDELIHKLSRQMQLLSKNQDFEEAAKLRDQITALARLGTSGTEAGRQDELTELKRILKLKGLPRRIEALDISDISGREACGSLVSFFEGRPDKKNYRRFRIKTVHRIDDYDMLREVVRRRYSRLIEENITFPDLVLIDGGKGHLESAGTELKKLGREVPLVSLAKEEENIYCDSADSPLRLKEGSPALNLLRRIRDEAHRFALSYHHILHRKKIMGR